jgi:hypothetical protein
MGSRGVSWLKGCGLGCGIVSLLAAGACVAGMMYFKSLFRGVSAAEASREKLVASLGEIGAYVPPPSGAIPGPRLSIFLTVRESLKEAPARLEASIARIPSDEEFQGQDNVVGKVLEGLGAVRTLIDQVGAYLEARDHELLRQEMGIGEYVYIYGLVYYSWLGHDPEDGPEIVRHVGGEDGRAVRLRYRRYFLPVLQAQLASLDEQPRLSVDDGWRSTLAREIRRFEDDPGRVMWQDGLPAPIRESLEPFRARLETTYSRTTNCFELPLAKHEAPWSGGGRW